VTVHTVTTCVVCGAQTEAFLCGSERSGSGCLGKLLRSLGDCSCLVEELDTTIARCDKLGTASVGFVTNGGDEIPLPINMNASDSKTLLRDRLVSWCRDLWESNAAREEGGAVPPLDLRPGVLAASRWLMRHPTWIALHPAVDELYDEIRETIRLAWRAVDTAPDKVYIGTCSAPLEGDPDDEQDEPSECTEELYAREGDWEKRCPVCMTIHDVRERQGVLSTAVEHQYVPQHDLIGLVTGRGARLTTSMFRNLRARRRIASFVRVLDGDPGASVTDAYGWRVRLWTSDDVGLEPLYHVGRVLDVLTTGKYARTTEAA
jgi:hypothetical protein